MWAAGRGGTVCRSSRSTFATFRQAVRAADRRTRAASEPRTRPRPGASRPDRIRAVGPGSRNQQPADRSPAAERAAVDVCQLVGQRVDARGLVRVEIEEYARGCTRHGVVSMRPAPARGGVHGGAHVGEPPSGSGWIGVVRRDGAQLEPDPRRDCGPRGRRSRRRLPMTRVRPGLHRSASGAAIDTLHRWSAPLAKFPERRVALRGSIEPVVRSRRNAWKQR